MDFQGPPEPVRTPSQLPQADNAKDGTIADDSKTLADSGAVSSSAAASRPSISVPDHELLTCIGRGSYGEVWLARNVMGTFRAVKIVYRAAFEHARPFEREFNGIQKFEPISRSHDGFVDVLQIGRTPEYFYYVMELADDVVTGQQIDPATYAPKTLRSQVQGRKALPFEACVDLGLSLTAALSHLHGHGLIHRDIKPSNIIFVNGIPKLADIGLVAEQSEAKSFVGTEGFIPPEGPGTPQADIYSLGKVLYEMATGKDRHEFPALPTLLGNSAGDLQLLELNSVFLKACQSDIGQRYQMAAQMTDDLMLLRSGKSVKRAQAAERRLAWMTKASMAGIIVTLVIATGFAYARRQALRETTLRRRAEAGEAALRRNLYVAEIGVAQTALQGGDVSRAKALLDQWSSGREQEDLRGFEWHYLRGLCRNDEAATFRGEPGVVQRVAVSPDGTTIAAGGNASSLNLWDLRTQRALPCAIKDGEYGALEFSPDGHFFAASSGDIVNLWEAATQHLVTNRAFGGQVWRMAFAPSGDRLAVATRDGATPGVTTVLGSPTLRVVAEFQNPNNPRPSVAYSPDRQWLAFGQRDGVIRVFDATTQSEKVKLAGFPQPVTDVAFSSDSLLLAAAHEGTLVRLWDVRTMRPLGVLSGHKHRVSAIAFAHKIQWLATGSIDGSITIWDVSTHQEITTLRGHTAWVNAVVFVADDQTLISGSDDGTVKVWRLNRLAGASQAEASTATACVALFSPNSQELVVGHEDGAVSIRPLDLDRTVVRLPGHGDPVNAIALSGNGQRLAVASGLSLVELWHLNPPQVLLSTNLMCRFSARLIRLAFTCDESSLVVMCGGELLANVPLEKLPPAGPLDGQPISGAATDISDTPWAWFRSTPHQGVIAFASVERREERLSLNLYPSQLSGGTLDSPGGLAVGAISLDGHYAAIRCLSRSPIRILDRLNRRQIISQLALPPFPYNCRALEFSRDAGVLAVGTDTGRVYLLKSPRFEVEGILSGHNGWVSSIAFSPDGRTLATSGNDGAVKLWNLATFRELLTMPESVSPFSTISFSADGQSLLCHGEDQRVRLWHTHARP